MGNGLRVLTRLAQVTKQDGNQCEADFLAQQKESFFKLKNNNNSNFRSITLRSIHYKNSDVTDELGKKFSS